MNIGWVDNRLWRRGEGRLEEIFFISQENIQFTCSQNWELLVRFHSLRIKVFNNEFPFLPELWIKCHWKLLKYAWEVKNFSTCIPSANDVLKKIWMYIFWKHATGKIYFTSKVQWVIKELLTWQRKGRLTINWRGVGQLWRVQKSNSFYLFLLISFSFLPWWIKNVLKNGS